jgi:hypothetical protein
MFKWKTMALKIKLTIIILILSINGCSDKDDFTLPVKVYFKIGISPVKPLDSEYLSFTECQIGIQRILFEGKREAGTDIFFETDPKMNLQTLSFTQEPMTISVFDIPQGVYNYMRWDISMKCIETEGLIDDRDESYPCIGIIISGNYKALDGSLIPFIFAIDEPEQFSVMSSDPDGNSSIVLSVSKEYEATVFFAPGRAFSAISRESFEEAEISGDSEHPKIIISSSKNKYLYEILLYRIFLSASVIVK